MGVITSNKIESTLDKRRKEILANKKKWEAEQRGNRAPIVTTNKTQPKTFETGKKVVGADLSKMITTLDLKDTKAHIEAKKKAQKKKKAPAKSGGKQTKSTKKSSDPKETKKKNEAPARSESVDKKKKT
jgi:hypothetical protein